MRSSRLQGLPTMSESFHPSQWIRRKDPRTQRTYYVNRHTGRSTWDPMQRTAVDTEPVTALFQAVVPVLDIPAASLTTVADFRDAKSTPLTPQLVTVPSSAAAAVNSFSQAEAALPDGPSSSLPANISTGSGAGEAMGQQEGPPVLPTDVHAPASSPVSALPALPDLTRATPLGTSAAPRVGSPTATAAEAVVSPTEQTVVTESSLSISSTHTQRPSDSVTAALLSGSNKRHFPFPSCVPSRPTPANAAGTAVDAQGEGRAGGDAAPTSESAGAAASSAATAQQDPPLDSEADTALEAAAAEEWQLTQRIWELEAERAGLESELAVLRGPVEVEAQSIAEDHSRLLEAQRAIEAAASLAMRQQQTKRAELEGLRRRLSELQDQRTSSQFLLTTLQSRWAVVSERCRAVETEEAQLQQQRTDLENVSLPAEETALRSAQERLAELRQHVGVHQQQQEDEHHRSLQRARQEMQRLQQRLEELAAMSTDEGRETSTVVTPMAHRERQVVSRENRPPTAGDGAHDALVAMTTARVNRTSSTVSTPVHPSRLHLRIDELRSEMATIQSAHRALYESEVLAGQQQALAEWTQRVRGEAETWRSALEDAAAMVKQLRCHHKTQGCKYEVLARDTAAGAATW